MIPTTNRENRMKRDTFAKWEFNLDICTIHVKLIDQIDYVVEPMKFI